MSDAQTTSDRVHLSILTPEEVLFEGDVLWAQVPLLDGLVGIWPGHAPLVGAIASGVIAYRTSKNVQQVTTTGGVLRVGVERCAVLVNEIVVAPHAVEADREGLGQELVAGVQDALSEAEVQRLQKAR